MNYTLALFLCMVLEDTNTDCLCIESGEIVITYLSPEQVCEMLPGITKGQLSQWRYLAAGGPPYRKLGKKILYVESQVIDWVEGSARIGTALAAG
jgi:hypothetical protein